MSGPPTEKHERRRRRHLAARRCPEARRRARRHRRRRLPDPRAVVQRLRALGAGGHGHPFARAAAGASRVLRPRLGRRVDLGPLARLARARGGRGDRARARHRRGSARRPARRQRADRPRPRPPAGGPRGPGADPRAEDRAGAARGGGGACGRPAHHQLRGRGVFRPARALRLRDVARLRAGLQHVRLRPHRVARRGEGWRDAARRLVFVRPAPADPRGSGVDRPHRRCARAAAARCAQGEDDRGAGDLRPRHGRQPAALDGRRGQRAQPVPPRLVPARAPRHARGRADGDHRGRRPAAGRAGLAAVRRRGARHAPHRAGRRGQARVVPARHVLRAQARAGLHAPREP